jgi:3-oxoacyl-[acyl-carrier-protein] synthase II
MTSDRSVWITGVGVSCPLGVGFDGVSEALLAGESGIGPVDGFDVAQHPCRIAGQLSLPACPEGIEPAAYDALWPLEKCAVFCSVQALQDAGLWDQRQHTRIGLVLGLAAEWMSHWDCDSRRGGRLISSAAQTHRGVTDMVGGMLAIAGPAIGVAAACASGNHALAQASHWLQTGWADVCLAGACDMGVTPYSLASFGNLRALSRRNDDPAAAVRPFDADRDGMVLGEGGAMFVLERADRAREAGRRPYAELASVGMTSDAYHLVTPGPDGTRAVAAIDQALRRARVNRDEIDYINAHATGTPVGDACEARMLHMVLGPHAGDTPVSSTKSMTGHLLGAAAAVEALACLTAIAHGAIPPTINLDHPDPECALDHVAKTARQRRVKVAVSNSFGFGGHNTALVLKAA